jgi:hypothetical protein
MSDILLDDESIFELTHLVDLELGPLCHVGKRVYLRLSRPLRSTFCHVLRCSVV